MLVSGSVPTDNLRDIAMEDRPFLDVFPIKRRRISSAVLDYRSVVRFASDSGDIFVETKFMSQRVKF